MTPLYVFWGSKRPKHAKKRSERPKKFQKHKGEISLCITSPPYFGREIYSLDTEQSCIKFPNYKDWCEGFYEPMIRTYFDYLKPKGHLLLNVADTKMSDGSYIPIEQTTIEFCVKQGFKYLFESFILLLFLFTELSLAIN